MKIRAFFLYLIFCGISATLVNSRAAQVWQNQSIQSKNTTVDIKRMILDMKDALAKDYDQFPELIKEMEAQAASCQDSATVALLHSMTAELYQKYYLQNRWAIDRRTQLSHYVPEDIREWTTNLFTDKIRSELALSLTPALLLQQTPVTAFKELLNTGSDAASLRPTLYEFLAFRAIDIQPSPAIYKEIIAFQNKAPNMKAVVLTELDFYHFLYQQKRNKEAYTSYLNALDEMYRNHLTQEYAVEILIAKLELISGSRYRYLSYPEKPNATLAEEMSICQEGIQRFPNNPRTAILRNHANLLQQSTLSVSTDNTVYPGKKAALHLSYKNIDKINVQIYRSLKSPLKAEQTKNIYRSDEKRGDLVKEMSFSLRLPNTFSQQDTTLFIPLEEMGLYECLVKVPEKELTTENLISVSRMVTTYRVIADNQREVMVLDYLSGKPVSQAKVTYYSGRRSYMKAVGSVITNKEGIAILPNNIELSAFQASLSKDRFGRLSTAYFREKSIRKIPQEQMELSLFTDRGIYRPGQTIFFKGIASIKGLEKSEVPVGQTFQVTLYDANGKEVGTKQFTTNEFGSFHGEFLLPQRCLNGSFRLLSGSTQRYVKVEEYKRPSFKADFLPIQGTIAFNDLVTLKGKVATYSGIALPEGKVTWQIMRRPFWLRMSMRPNISTQLEEGTTSLAADGTFSIQFRPKKEAENDLLSAYQTYEVIAKVTDSKGETQPCSYHFIVGESGLVLSSNLPSQVERKNVDVRIEAQTLNGEKTAVSGSFQIIELVDKKPHDKASHFTEGKLWNRGTFTSGKALQEEVFQRLPSGRYRLAFEAKDEHGRLCKNYSDFILYGNEDKRPPVFTHTWVLKEKTTCLPGEQAEIIFGSSDADAYVLYEWFVDNKRIHQERFKMSNVNRKFQIPFQSSYGKGLVASFTFVKKGELYVTQVPIQREVPNRELTIRPISFRDRLLPGSKESWQFRITDADSTLVSAEVLASMYDASLDKLVPFNWYFLPQRTLHFQAPRYLEGTGFQQNYHNTQSRVHYDHVNDYAFNQLNWFDLFRNTYYGHARSLGQLRMKAAYAGTNMNVSQNDALQVERQVECPEETDMPMSSNEIREDEAMAALRTDFSETAFFYPTLRTNQAGDILLHFDIPESNTTWKLQVLAHTKDLKRGLFTHEVVTHKPLMVLPNYPRFVRQGDEVQIQAQVINNSEEKMTGRVSIKLFDPSTNEPLICLSKSLRTFDLRPDSIATVGWKIPIPKQGNLMGIRILAHSNKGSDGEQQIVPVLSNQVLITESTPFYFSKEGEQAIQMQEKKGKSPFRLTLELTANPIWYAVQALPTISEPSNENILAWLAAYYSNTLATHIAESHPRIQQVIAQWTAQGGDENTLYSNLQKNQEIKDILLEETPWVLEAATESEQKHRLALLFNANRSKHLQETAIRQLKEQQDVSGGWSWFKGFPASRSITLSVLEGMAQLVQLNATQYESSEKEMQIKALKFTDKAISEDFEQLQKRNNNWQNMTPSQEQIRYLYVRSAYRDIPELGEAREAIRFYTRQAAKHWKKYPLKTQAEIAMLMFRNGKKEEAASIMAWLKKTASHSEEQGMYWANNRKSYHYFASPVETHCSLMAAFHEIESSISQMNSMKQWLLNQKRTQNWESEPATVQAIYALLLTGSDWLTDSNTCTVTWGKQTYNSMKEGELATGYLKTVLPSNETTRPTLSIEKKGDNPAWGAVYEQYFQDITEVEGQKGVLNVEKQMFIEKNTDAGQHLQPISSEQKLQVGDKLVVRLVVRTDRDLEYVSLKDGRAGCLEPANALSRTTYREGVWYYQSSKDVSENFFFNELPKGTFVIEYPVYVTREGNYANGICTIQCQYAPEFVSHTAGSSIKVEK